MDWDKDIINKTASSKTAMDESTFEGIASRVDRFYEMESGTTKHDLIQVLLADGYTQEEIDEYDSLVADKQKISSLKTAVKEVPVKVYEFKELSDEAKERAKREWYANEDFDFLSEELEDSLKSRLTEHGIEYDDSLKLYYSLSYSQGDGVMFAGKFRYKDLGITIKQQGHYYHSNSAVMTFENESYEEVDNEVTAEFKTIYETICGELEKQGYDEIEYQQTDEYFNDLCEANGYNFYENGQMANL